jgi:hypothetical protein
MEEAQADCCQGAFVQDMPLANQSQELRDLRLDLGLAGYHDVKVVPLPKPADGPYQI